MRDNALIHCWFPGLFDFKGGIQVYSQFLLQALQEVYPQARYEVFLLHDRQAANSDSGNVQFHCYGHLPAKLRIPAFTAGVIAAGLQQQPDLVITSHLNFTQAAWPLKRLAGIPYWTVAHGFEAWTIPSQAVRRALVQADRVLTVSRHTRDRLLAAQPLDPTRLFSLPNTFNPDRFRIAPKPAHLLQKYGFQATQPIILTVNRLESGESFHSYDQILAALPQIRQVMPTVQYVIVGEGSDRPRLEQLIAARNLQNCVTLAGFIPDSELPDYYNLCDVFAMPSKLEGFGIVYLEALASGKPVLGGLDGAIDALQQGRLGALVNPDAIDTIAMALIEILQHRYPNLLLYQPQQLRSATIAAFGPAAFQYTLSVLLESSPLHYCPSRSLSELPA